MSAQGGKAAGGTFWRAMRPEDLPGVCALAEIAHPGLPERREVFEEKLRLFPAGCFTLSRDGALAGYGISHPWTLHDIPSLDAFLGGLPPAPDCLYLHDVAAAPAARGHGAAAALILRLCDTARREGLAFLALTSVHGTRDLWARLGFSAASGDAAASRLRSYGPEAAYMVRRLAS